MNQRKRFNATHYIHTVRKGSGVTVGDQALVVKYTKLCLREIYRAEHEIPVSGIGLRIVTKRGRGTSYGSRYEITIDTKPDFHGIYEYAAYANDPVIGDNRKASREMALAAVVAHEIAHHIQYACGPQTRWLKKKYRKAHGEGFRDIYRILRSRVINPVVDAEAGDLAA